MWEMRWWVLIQISGVKGASGLGHCIQWNTHNAIAYDNTLRLVPWLPFVSANPLAIHASASGWHYPCWQ